MACERYVGCGSMSAEDSGEQEPILSVSESERHLVVSDNLSARTGDWLRFAFEVRFVIGLARCTAHLRE